MARGSKSRAGGRGRVAVLLVLSCVVFLVFFARLAWMQFAMADHYAEKAAEASSASYTVEQHAARGAITDRNSTVLARDKTVYDRSAAAGRSCTRPDWYWRFSTPPSR